MTTALTAAQQSALATDINSAGNAAALGALITTKDEFQIAAFYNAVPGGQTFNIWRSNISVDEIKGALVGSDYTALTVQQCLLFNLLMSGRQLDATNANIRNDFSTIFNAKQSLTNFSALAQQLATRVQQLFSTGSPGVAAVMSVSQDDIKSAMGW